jgi:uncharacterized protein (DUF2062 family)
MTRLIYELRTEGAGGSREAVALGLGLFIGCLPLYGLHLALCWMAGLVLGLNRLKLYLAANISNPFMAPLLLFTEIQAGAWLRRGRFHALTLDTVRSVNAWQFGADLIVGSLAVGGLLGALLGLATWALTRRRDADPEFANLVRRASDRYLPGGIAAWEFARGKMRGDPLYRMVVAGGLLPVGGTLVDVGCGQGLMLALLIEAGRVPRPSRDMRGPAPAFDRLVGIELRRRVAALARAALGAGATIVESDVRGYVPADCRAVLFFDVLHLMPAADQEAVLRTMAGVLAPDGVILVREADAASGWMFRAVRWGNRLKAVAFGNWSQTFHFRTRAGWVGMFEAAGFAVDARDASMGTPFGNVMFVLTRRPGSA